VYVAFVIDVYARYIVGWRVSRTAHATVDVVLTTGAPVQRGGHVEVLAIGRENVEVAPRIPLLDSHRQTSIADIKGSVSNVRFEPGAIVATLHVSDPAALAAIARGDVTGVSVGYRVKKWSEGRDAKTGQRVRTATLFEIVEASLVAVPADVNATVRSTTMEENEVIDTGQQETISDPPENATRAETNAHIRSAVSYARLPTTFADSLIDREATVEEARSAVFSEMQRRSVNVSTIRVGPSGDDPAVVNDRMAEALACRATGMEPSEAARPYMTLAMSDMARLSLQRSGATGIAMLGREELLTRAMHTTSDFPNLLTSTGNRILMPAYQAAESPLKRLARQRSADDFRPVSLVKLGEFGKLQKVTEAGEIKALSTGEATEGMQLETFGGMFNLSRKAIVNDDLGAFARWAAMMGTAAAETESDQLVALLTAASGLGPIMGDGKRLFHVDHGNLAADAAAPDVDTLSAARLALRRQTGLDGVLPISATPKFFLVPPELETLAEKLLAQLNAATVDTQNPFSGKLTLLVEPRLTRDDWYVFADPAVLPVLEYAYLSSAPGPQLSSRDGWEVLGREFRVVLDFGCGAVDWRGAYRNAGVDTL
ncbi:MAG: Mu-like prophage major head subunit gpT family protein, partial [Novosphingobium sp.]|nr:Mu-like prophage major head subunit gpT family protein [Novosphingobium sp.]